MNTERHVESPRLKPVVTVTGTANAGEVGPGLGKIDIGASEKAYLFRVALPGVRCNQRNIKCHVRINGRVEIEGVITGSGGALKDQSAVYEAKVQELCPPGGFSISFNLPGPVDPRLASLKFKPDGVLEVVVMKYRITVFPENNHQFPSS